MPDYSSTVIYKLCCIDTSITEIYIGSTCNFRRRKNHHKSNCHNENNKDYNLKVYQFIREHGGFENWDMVMVHQQSVENKLDKGKLERTFIEDLNPSLNCNIPTRTKKEWYDDNPEYQKQYNESNKKQISEQKRQYREAHKEQLREQAIQKHDCDCGGKYTHQNKLQHIKTKKHQKYVNA